MYMFFTMNAGFMWTLIKNVRVESYDEKITFHGDHRPSLWRRRAQSGRSHVERQV